MNPYFSLRQSEASKDVREVAGPQPGEPGGHAARAFLLGASHRRESPALSMTRDVCCAVRFISRDREPQQRVGPGEDYRHRFLTGAESADCAHCAPDCPGLPPGDYNVLLRKNGYSPKRANVTRQCTRFTRRILRLVLPP